MRTGAIIWPGSAASLRLRPTSPRPSSWAATTGDWAGRGGKHGRRRQTGYLPACKEVLGDGRSSIPYVLGQAAYACSLAPGVDGPERLVTPAERADAIEPRSNFYLGSASPPSTQAGALTTTRSDGDRPGGGRHGAFRDRLPFLAMAYARLDRTDEARECLAKSEARANAFPLDGPDWDVRLTLTTLRARAEALLGTGSPEGDKDRRTQAGLDHDGPSRVDEHQHPAE